MTKFDFHYAGQPIGYELKRTSRKTLAVYVYPNRRVQLRVPHRAKDALITEYLHKSAPWIAKQLQQLPEIDPLDKSVISGSTQYFQGQAYVVQVHQGRPQRVEMQGAVLHIYSMDTEDVLRNERVLKQWYKQQATVLFAQRLQSCWQAMQSFNLPQPSLRLRWMKTRWGSCSRRAEVTLNLELVKRAAAELDYVIVHELCHLREFNHGPRFYAMMDVAMPDWRSRKKALETSVL